jgi:hypothetical protein
MLHAFVMLNCDLGRRDSTVEQIKALAGVSRVHKLRGVYDILVIVESETTEELKNTVRKMRSLDSITSSLTLVSSPALES